MDYAGIFVPSYYLGGRNSNIFYFHPWGNDPIRRAYFSSGLKPPTSFIMQVYRDFLIFHYKDPQ